MLAIYMTDNKYQQAVWSKSTSDFNSIAKAIQKPEEKPSTVMMKKYNIKSLPENFLERISEPWIASMIMWQAEYYAKKLNINMSKYKTKVLTDKLILNSNSFKKGEHEREMYNAEFLLMATNAYRGFISKWFHKFMDVIKNLVCMIIPKQFIILRKYITLIIVFISAITGFSLLAWAVGHSLYKLIPGKLTSLFGYSEAGEVLTDEEMKTRIATRTGNSIVMALMGFYGLVIKAWPTINNLLSSMGQKGGAATNDYINEIETDFNNITNEMLTKVRAHPMYLKLVEQFGGADEEQKSTDVADTPVGELEIATLRDKSDSDNFKANTDKYTGSHTKLYEMKQQLFVDMVSMYNNWEALSTKTNKTDNLLNNPLTKLYEKIIGRLSEDQQGINIIQGDDEDNFYNYFSEMLYKFNSDCDAHILNIQEINNFYKAYNRMLNIQLQSREKTQNTSPIYIKNSKMFLNVENVLRILCSPNISLEDAIKQLLPDKENEKQTLNPKTPDDTPGAKTDDAADTTAEATAKTSENSHIYNFFREILLRIAKLWDMIFTYGLIGKVLSPIYKNVKKIILRHSSIIANLFTQLTELISWNTNEEKDGPFSKMIKYIFTPTFSKAIIPIILWLLDGQGTLSSLLSAFMGGELSSFITLALNFLPGMIGLDSVNVLRGGYYIPDEVPLHINMRGGKRDPNDNDLERIAKKMQESFGKNNGLKFEAKHLGHAVFVFNDYLPSLHKGAGADFRNDYIYEGANIMIEMPRSNISNSKTTQDLHNIKGGNPDSESVARFINDVISTVTMLGRDNTRAREMINNIRQIKSENISVPIQVDITASNIDRSTKHLLEEILVNPIAYKIIYSKKHNQTLDLDNNMNMGELGRWMNDIKSRATQINQGLDNPYNKLAIMANNTL